MQSQLNKELMKALIALSSEQVIHPDFPNPINPITRAAKRAYKWGTSPVTDADPGIGAVWPRRRGPH